VTKAGYGLGHDDRAKQPQPVASRLGDRYLPWQLEKTPEQSWEECERHAENLRQLLGEKPQTFNEESSSNNYQSEKQLRLLQTDKLLCIYFDHSKGLLKGVWATKIPIY